MLHNLNMSLYITIMVTCVNFVLNYSINNTQILVEMNKYSIRDY